MHFLDPPIIIDNPTWNLLYHYCIFYICLQGLSWEDKISTIIGPNVPMLSFRGDFLPAHLEPGSPGALQSQKRGPVDAVRLSARQNTKGIHEPRWIRRGAIGIPSDWLESATMPWSMLEWTDVEDNSVGIGDLCWNPKKEYYTRSGEIQRKCRFGV